ncbi:hypothetical protein ACT454_002661 [Enterococcus faecium]
MFRKSTLVGAIIVLLFSFLSPIISVQAVSKTMDSTPNVTQTTEESRVETTKSSSDPGSSSEVGTDTTSSEQTSNSSTEENAEKSEETSIDAPPVQTESTTGSITDVDGINTGRVSDLEEPDTGMIYMPEKSPEGDPLKGGTLAINQKFSVPVTEVAYNDLVSYHIGFKITWTVPEGMNPQQFINALDMNNTSIWLGNNKLKISRNSFEINVEERKIEYEDSSNSFDLFSIIRYLWSLVFGRGTAEIWSYLHLDVNKLSENNPNDFSIGKIVTEGKLPPNQTNELSSTVTLYGLKDKTLRNYRLSTGTWSNYISPWSAEKANSEENGKKDDTQVGDSTEVLGINRVLKGSDYKNRTVEIPITEEINPSEYIRVVNLFTKQVVTNVPVTIDSPAVKNDIDKQGDTSFLNRSTTYYYRGDQLSPVPIHFLQKSHLKLVVNGGGSYSEKEEIPVKGMVETEGEAVRYFYRVDQGEELPLENRSNQLKQLDARVTGLTAGDHTITIKAVNEFGLDNTAEVRVTVYSGQLSLDSVPNRINFGEAKKSSETITLPGISEGNLIVSDTRPETKKTNWVLNLRSSVSLVGEHTSLTYTNRKNKQLMINQADQPIEENLPNKPDKDNISEGWSNKTQGLFLKIPPEDQKIGEYSGKLIWTLQNTPSPN